MPDDTTRADRLTEMRYEQEMLTRWGLLDPDQPTRWAHYQARRAAMAEFSPLERALIRSELGIHGV